jgi:hypothetical protein
MPGLDFHRPTKGDRAAGNSWDARQKATIQLEHLRFVAPGTAHMSVDFRSVDPKEAWLKVLERLYHEDHILYARMNNFSTVQAFLATALAFTTSGTTTALNISLIVSCLVWRFRCFTFRSVFAVCA